MLVVKCEWPHYQMCSENYKPIISGVPVDCIYMRCSGAKGRSKARVKQWNVKSNLTHQDNHKMDGALLSQCTQQYNFLHVHRLLLDERKTVGLLWCRRSQQTSTDSTGEEFHDSYNNLQVLPVVLFVQQHLEAFKIFIYQWEVRKYDFILRLTMSTQKAIFYHCHIEELPTWSCKPVWEACQGVLFPDLAGR